MRYILSLIIILFFGQNLLAQKFDGFFIEPSVSWKISTSLKSNHLPPLENEYFEIKAKQFIAPRNFSPLFLGLNLGYNFKNNDKIHLGLHADGIAHGHELLSSEYNYFYPNIPLPWGRERNTVVSAATNINLLYKRSILFIQSKAFKKEGFVRVHLNIGLSYIHRLRINNLPHRYNSGSSHLLADGSRIIIESTDYDISLSFKKLFKYNLGLNFTFGKKEEEKFNLNIAFITNRANGVYYTYQSSVVKIIKANETKQYFYELKGKGNGIYITLSKRIYPFLIKKRMHERKMARYNDFKNKSPNAAEPVKP
jgi:hypothetical protein